MDRRNYAKESDDLRDAYANTVDADDRIEIKSRHCKVIREAILEIFQKFDENKKLLGVFLLISEITREWKRLKNSIRPSREGERFINVIGIQEKTWNGEDVDLMFYGDNKLLQVGSKYFTLEIIPYEYGPIICLSTFRSDLENTDNIIARLAGYRLKGFKREIEGYKKLIAAREQWCEECNRLIVKGDKERANSEGGNKDGGR